MDVRLFQVCGKLKILDSHNSETPWQIKKKIVPNFPLMTTTDSQNFKEIQEIGVHQWLHLRWIFHAIRHVQAIIIKI